MRSRLVDVLRRLRRLERREVGALRRWVENTSNLIHLSTLLLVPVLLGVVTVVSNALAELSFLLFPPLASGTYTLFADPEGRYADPVRFVAGLTVGALCGWAAIEATVLSPLTPTVGGVDPASAALAVFLTGAATWLLDVEEPASFSTALLVLVTDRAGPATYVLSVVLLSTLVAVGFSLWRSQFYERRARFLYQSTRGDDHVLVPMRGDRSTQTAVFGARLAAAHDAGKVVLLDVVDDERLAAAERERLGDGVGEASGDGVGEVSGDGVGEASGDGVGEVSGDGVGEATGGSVEVADTGGTGETGATPERVAADAAASLERRARTIRTRFEIPCEVVVAAGAPGDVTIRTAHETNCDLIVTPYETADGGLAEWVRTVLRSDTDVTVFRSTTGGDRWERVLVAVSRPGDSAHAMIDFAERLADDRGAVSVCTCIDREAERRPAETRLANLAETADGPVETRVARSDIHDFLAANDDAYDLVILGSSGDRSAASRFVSPPTFERLSDLSTDVAVVDRGGPGGR